MKYTTLGFTMHKKCNATCKICCFESSPTCKEKLDIDLIKKYILSTKENKELKTISFTGGEPFLEYESLKDLIKFTSENGKVATCITNGYWATTYEETLEKLGKLKSLGLKRISVSYDNFHKEFIDVKNIRNILNATKILSIPTALGMVKINDGSIGELINELGNSLTNVSTNIYSCFPAGRARKELNEADFIRNLISEHQSCPYNGNVVVSYDGKIYPCCSQLVVETELSVDNFSESDYTTTLRKIKNNGILYILRNYGLDFFVDIAKGELSMDVPEFISSPCELCAMFFTKENIDKFYPFVKDKINTLTKRG